MQSEFLQRMIDLNEAMMGEEKANGVNRETAITHTHLETAILWYRQGLHRQGLEARPARQGDESDDEGI